jgi:LPXTG-motif cell wall-anchored protein
MNTKLFICLFFCLLLPLAYSQTLPDDSFASNIFHKGDVDLRLDKEAYSAGDLLFANITVSNMEDYPLVDAYLVVEMVSGSEHIYPSQNSDNNNVFYEEIIPRINLDSKTQTSVSFSYRIPDDLKSGDYLLEAYLKTPRTPVTGIPFIFISPKGVNFKVEGNGNFPSARISRTRTVFAGGTGPIGSGVNPNSIVNGSVHVLGAAGRDLMLNITVCSWDDTSCDANGLYWNKEYQIKSDLVEETVLVSFNAPEKPDAYAIRLELFEGERLLSLYRSRIIVMGETAKIRKLTISNSSYSAGDIGKALVLVGASPDHYTKPSMENITVLLSIKDLEKNKEVYTGTSLITVLNIDLNEGLEPLEFEFKNNVALNNFSVCAAVSSQDQQYDRYCFIIDTSKIKPKIDARGALNSSWAYDSSTGTLQVNICSTVPGNRSAAAILMSEGTVVASADNIVLAPCGQADLSTGIGKYSLVINDLYSNQQYFSEVDITQGKATTTTTTTILVCGDGICEKGEDASNCCSDCGCVVGSCSGNVCKTAEKPVDTGTNPNIWYLLLGLALIIVGFLLYFRRKK